MVKLYVTWMKGDEIGTWNIYAGGALEAFRKAYMRAKYQGYTILRMENL